MNGPMAMNEPAAPGWTWRAVCRADALLEGGDGVRFDFKRPWGLEQAFVIRYRGQPRSFLNRCSHVPVELDWMPGRFFDDSGLYLVCATHGAIYGPADGQCVGGPCSGRGLKRLESREADGQVWVLIQEQE